MLEAVAFLTFTCITSASVLHGLDQLLPTVNRHSKNLTTFHKSAYFVSWTAFFKSPHLFSMGLCSGHWPCHSITLVWNQDAAHLLMCSGSWACWNAHSTGIMQLDPLNQAHLSSMIRPRIMMHLPPDSPAFTAVRWLEFSVEGSSGKLRLLDQHKKNNLVLISSIMAVSDLPRAIIGCLCYLSYQSVHSDHGFQFSSAPFWLCMSFWSNFRSCELLVSLLLIFSHFPIIVLTKYLILNFSSFLDLGKKYAVFLMFVPVWMLKLF